MTKRVTHKVPWPNIPNAYVLISVGEKEIGETGHMIAEPLITYFYDGGKIGAEWEPKYGPIQVWETPTEDYEGEVKDHYFYPKVQHKPLNWSQMAVNDSGIKDSLLHGFMEHVFSVLKEWTDR